MEELQKLEWGCSHACRWRSHRLMAAVCMVPSSDGLAQAEGTFEPPAPGDNRASVAQRES